MSNLGRQFDFIHAENNTSGYHRVQATEGGKNIGNIDWDPETGRINMVHVVEEKRRQGIGTSLFHEAHNAAYREGLSTPKHDIEENMSNDGLNWSKKG